MSMTYNQPVGTHSIEASRWQIDPVRSRVEFRAPTFWGLVTVNGRFERFDGTLDLQDTPAIDLTIDPTSVETNNKKRDAHLRSTDFFDVKRHPEVRFASEVVELDGERLNVRGRLSAAGQSVPLDLVATLRRVGDELEVDARTVGDHTQLGMSRGLLGMIRPRIELIVHGRLARARDEGVGG